MVLKFGLPSARVLKFSQKISAGSYKTGSYKRRLRVCPSFFGSVDYFVKRNEEINLPFSKFFFNLNLQIEIQLLNGLYVPSTMSMYQMSHDRKYFFLTL